MDIVIKILQFIVSFSLLVLVHEFGHFIFARIFGVRVDRFKIFFGKSIFSFKKGETEYAIGWLPFGGYCKLSGMIDESMDTDFIGTEPQPYEFRSKPAWKRLLIMIGGVLMNVLLALVIYIGMSYTWGEQYLSTRDMKYGYLFSEEAESLGLRDGDRIISVNGKEIEDFNQLYTTLILEQKSTVKLEREGEVIEIRTPETSVMDLMESKDFIVPRYPFVVAEVVEGGNAAVAGIQKGDSIVSVGGVPATLFDEVRGLLAENRDRSVAIGFIRNDDGIQVPRTAEVTVSDDGMIGVTVDMLQYMPIHYSRYSFLESFPAGFKRVGSEISGYWKQIKLLVQPKTEAYKSLGGPLSIGNIFPGHWEWYRFWTITALLSIVLAVMNLLPIPGLDGGHVLFLLVEMITGRKPGDKFIMYAQVIGILLIISLMVYATGNDIYNIFIKK